MSFPTLSELNVAAGRTVDSEQGIYALNAARIAVQSACGWPIEQTSSVHIGMSDGSQVYLPTLYLTAITSLTVDGAATDPSTVTFLPNGLVSWPGWNWLSRRVQIEYVHGYAPLPEDVHAAVLDIAVVRVSSPAGGQAVRSESEGIGSYQRAVTYAGSGSADPAVDPRLARYRLPSGFA